MTVILVFPQSCGGFWGGVTECGSGNTRSSRSVALCSARRWTPGDESGASAVAKPVNTVVDAQSRAVVRGSPAADPVLAPLSAPEDPPVSEDIAVAEDAAVAEDVEDFAIAAVAAVAAVAEDTPDSEPEQADVEGNSGKCVNLDTD